MGKIIYPYQNTSLKDLSQEKWKDIPGFEGLYQLSNYGRIKSLERWIDTGRFDSLKSERIVKPRIVISPKGDVSLQMKLHKERKRYCFSVARYVYFLFINPFDLDDQSLVVTFRNGDHLFLRHKNLKLQTRSEVAKSVIYTGKRIRRSQSNIKPVTQYDMQGKRVAVFESTVAAAQATGHHKSLISGALSGSLLTAGGFIWRKGKGKSRIDASAVRKRLAKRHQSSSKKVAQFTLRGRKIAVFASFVEAAKKVGGSPKQISHAARGISWTSYGYKWELEDD